MADGESGDRRGVRGEPSAFEAVPQDRTGPRKSGLDRADGAVEPTGDLLAGVAAEVVQQDRHAVVIGEPVDLTEQGLGVPGDGAIGEDRLGLRGATFEGAATHRVVSGPARDPQGDAVEPAVDRLSASDRAGPRGEHEEGGLEGVVGGVRVVEDRPADAADHRPVPPHQGLEGRLPFHVSGLFEPMEEPRIGPLPQGPDAKERRQVIPRRSPEPLPRHRSPSTLRPSCPRR